MSDYNINDFLKYPDPVCREERQYAAFLYHIFLCAKNNTISLPDEYKNIIRESLAEENNNIEIQQVFFEATILRDYKERTKDSPTEFNDSLFAFSGISPDDLKNENEVLVQKLRKYHLGANASKILIRQITDSTDSIIGQKLLLASNMMNAKPDFMVIYNGKARIIECKYHSKEGSYKDIKGTKTIRQELIQECIMAFLFGCRADKKIDDILAPYNLPDDTYKNIFREMLKNNSGIFDGIKNFGVYELDFKDKDKSYYAEKLIETVYNAGG